MYKPRHQIPKMTGLKYDLDTPCLVIDIDLFEANLQKMQALVAAAGKNLRPHAKTHKSSVIARRQLKAGAVGLCTAKLSEAEVLVSEGITDVLITGPVVTPSKLRRLADLLKNAPALTLVVDNLETAKTLNDIAAECGVTANIVLDIDVGQQRTGVMPAGAPALAQELVDLPALNFRGIQAYAGHAQHIVDYETRCRTGRECLQQATDVLNELKTNGIACDVFTAGGTGTLETDLQFNELTEVQPGSYALMDIDYRRLGSAENPAAFTVFVPALTLLTTVISANHQGHVTVDAGLKSVYQDGPAPQPARPDKNLTFSWFGDEYGRISVTEATARPNVGSVQELVVSHCDPTVNLFDRFVITQGEKVVDIWPIDLRGRSQ